MGSWFAQEKWDCGLEWGWDGARRAARRGDVIVVVDVLSFSTTTATATAHGAVLYPCQNEAEVRAVTQQTGAEMGVHRRDVPEKGRFSLSPVSFLNTASHGAKIALSSPNGATCCRLASEDREHDAPLVWVGALVNARATAARAAVAAHEDNTAITVLACGERWHTPNENDVDGPLRFAVEDLWGAGAIMAYLPRDVSLSPEARAARAAFLEVASDLEAALLACGSGQELVDKGYAGDVIHAACLNLYDVPVLLKNGITAPSI